MIAIPTLLQANTSTCYGSTKKGKILNAEKLPFSGENFYAYSSLAYQLGRTYVHSEVKKVVVSSYQTLLDTHPDTVFKYAETGHKKGGSFKPHKTHQNGLSVDFMVPVVDEKGTSVYLPTNSTNKFGYDIEFNQQSQYKNLSIDYEAMAAHIVTLHKTAKKNGIDFWRVIFDPELQHNLFNTPHQDYLKKHIQFSKKRSWVRHDEHYHIDFSIACEPLPS